MTELHVKMTAVGYYAEQLQRLSAEIQGLAYNLQMMHQNLQSPHPYIGRKPSDVASEMMQLGGSAAKLRSQLEHALRSVEHLAYAAESVAPKSDR